MIVFPPLCSVPQAAAVQRQRAKRKRGEAVLCRSAPGSMIYYVLEESRYAAVSVICVSSIESGSPSFLSVPLKVVSSFAGASSSTWVSTNEPLR